MFYQIQKVFFSLIASSSGTDWLNEDLTEDREIYIIHIPFTYTFLSFAKAVAYQLLPAAYLIQLPSYWYSNKDIQIQSCACVQPSYGNHDKKTIHFPRLLWAQSKFISFIVGGV